MNTLNDIITYVLHRNDPELAKQWRAHSPIAQPQGPDRDILRANHFLRIQLGLLEVDTTYARECLASDVDINRWIQIFEEVIVPVIRLYGLPIWRAEHG